MYQWQITVSLRNGQILKGIYNSEGRKTVRKEFLRSTVENNWFVILSPDQKREIVVKAVDVSHIEIGE